MPDKHLLIFTISPVQSYIAQARKTRDLFAGSQLLSDVMKNIKAQFQDKEIIFPQSSGSLPNRIIVEIEKDDIKKFCDELKETANKAFIDTCKSILDDCYNDIAEKQINSFLSINYVAVPLTNENDYQTAYTTAERYLDAVKHAGAFSQINEEAGRKCSLCGERNVIFYRKTEKGNIPKYTIDKAVEISDESLVYGEGLCAVCAAKRFYEGDKYPSTAYIALLNHLGEKQLDKWENETGCDAQLLYPENFTEDNYNEERKNSAPPFCEAERRRNLIFENTKIKPSLLNKYYALILFDGDDMGKWLSGKYLKEGTELEKFHKELSSKLSAFANDAVDIIDGSKEKEIDKSGRTIYAGGDDFMGFVSPAHLFSIMNDLEEKFHEKVNTDELKNFVKENKCLTFSTGIVIAHYKSPLSEVLKEARKQMEKAKQYNENKHSTALSFMIKSNNIYSTVFRQFNLELLKDIIHLLQDNEKRVSSKFIFNFAREFRLFEDVYKIDEYETFSSMMITELKRLYKRSNDPNYDEEFFLKLQRFFYSLVQDAGKGYTKIVLTEFISFLEMGDKLAREIDHVH